MSNFLLIYIAVIVTVNLVIAFRNRQPIYITTGVPFDPNYSKIPAQAVPVTAGPFLRKLNQDKKRGAIFMPKTDLDEAREAKIAANMAEGKDTPLSELE